MNAPVSVPVPVSVTINIADVLRGIWRRKLMVIVLTLAASLLALAFIMTAKTVYKTEARVLVENLETPFERIQQADQAARREITEADITSQIAVLTSSDLASRVIASLNLTERNEFNSLAQGIGTVSSLLIGMGFKDDPRLMSPDQRAMKRYNGMLTVYRVPESKVIAIAYESTDPATAAEVANTLAETYVTSTREAQSEPTGRAREWLSGQIEQLRQKVVDSEKAAESFRAKAGLLKGRESTLSAEALSELNTQIIQAAAQRAEAQAKANAIREALKSNGNVESSSEVLSSQLIQRLREQQVALKRQVSELSVTYLPSHPKMIAAQSEVKDLDRQIRQEVLKIVQGLEEQAKIAQTREAALRANLNSAKATASESNLDDVRLRELEREAAANREILEALLNRFTDANARNSLDAQPGMARIIQRAMVPSSPYYPKAGPTVVLAVVGGLALGLGLAFLLEIMAAAGRMDQAAMAPVSTTQPNVPAQTSPAFHLPGGPGLLGVSTAPPVPPLAPPPLASAVQLQPAAFSQPAVPQELIPALCELPHVPDCDTAILRAFEIISSPNGQYAASIKQLASWAASSRQTLGVRTVAVGAIDGAPHESGTAATALARALGTQVLRVILVDAARGGQQIDAMAGLSPGPGLAEILVGHSKFAELITADGASPIHILRAGFSIDVAAQYFSTNRMDAIVKTLEASYDAVIVNLGLLDAPARALARFAQAGVMLATPKQSTAVSQLAAEWRQAGLRAVQYLRISASSNVGSAMEQTPVNA
jgi:uncharacterized protein involved in exopolysaccharide biosynthesis